MYKHSPFFLDYYIRYCHEDELAESSFKKCLNDLPLNVDFQSIEHEFESIRKNEKRFNPKIAWALSLIIPGSGQFYSKEYKEAASKTIRENCGVQMVLNSK